MNRASEIAELLESILRHGAENTPIADLWATEFKVHPASSNFFLGMVCVEQKFEYLRAEVESLGIGDRAKGLFINALDNLRKFASIWQINNMTKTHLRAEQSNIDMLFLAAENLSDYMVPEINHITIETLEKEILGLIASVREASIENGFRSMLLASLGTLLMAIQAYRPLGPDGAAKLYGVATAEIARLSGTVARNSAEQKNLLSKALSVCKKAGAAIIFAGAVISGAHTAIEDGSAILGISDNTDQDGSTASDN